MSLSPDMFFEEFNRIDECFPYVSVWENYMQFFQRSGGDQREVCLVGIFAYMPEYEYLMRMESSCYEYHVLPYAGGWLDQPLILVEIFETIRGARVEYDLYRHKLLQAKQATQTSGPRRRF